MKSWRAGEAEQKVLCILFPKDLKDRLESLKQEFIVQSRVSNIEIKDSHFDNAIEVLIIGDRNTIVSACSVIFSSFIPDPLSETRMDILVPEKSVGKIIGKKGKNIEMIRQNTGTNIIFAKYSTALKVGKIDGTFEGILKAVQQIIDIIYEKPKRSGSVNFGK
ncbi:unnamed protein product [Blepharisma stoltei]|uniref:K Homology domain-containing protein n=1 Tax=Blepharisma stoltei TaxID=1481888 RepID=A0AAU9IBK8_9CILI|nr:unnamed protein product [Blepharisma stoltei]